MKPLLEHSTYKVYLKQILNEFSKSRRGVRSRLAEAISCQPGYVTQVLEGDAEFSPDQASLANVFFGHSEDESEYFLLLVLKARAATPELRRLLEARLSRHRERYLDLKERFKVESQLAPFDEGVFYSSWHYLGVLTVISLPGFQSKERIAERLKISLTRVNEVLERLIAYGLVISKNGHLRHGSGRTHLAKDSPHVSKHHLNWRLKAMESIEQRRSTDFHYSSLVSLSAEDAEAVKGILIRTLEEVARVVAPSKEEKICSLNLDFFEV